MCDSTLDIGFWKFKLQIHFLRITLSKEMFLFVIVSHVSQG